MAMNKLLEQKKKQKTESRQRILNVASRLFKKQGYKSTGIDQIMEEAGLTAGAFYAHFKSKNSLLDETLIFMLENSKNLLFKNLDQLTSLEKIETVMHRYCSSGHRDFPDRGCVLPSIAAELHRESEGSAKIISNYINQWAEFLIKNLPNQPNQRVRSLQIISQCVGAILLSRLTASQSISDEILKSNQNLN